MKLIVVLIAGIVVKTSRITLLIFVGEQDTVMKLKIEIEHKTGMYRNISSTCVYSFQKTL